MPPWSRFSSVKPDPGLGLMRGRCFFGYYPARKAAGLDPIELSGRYPTDEARLPRMTASESRTIGRRRPPFAIAAAT
jgi:hypothetical protein